MLLNINPLAYSFIHSPRPTYLSIYFPQFLLSLLTKLFCCLYDCCIHFWSIFFPITFLFCFSQISFPPDSLSPLPVMDNKASGNDPTSTMRQHLQFNHSFRVVPACPNRGSSFLRATVLKRGHGYLQALSQGF